MPIAPVGVLGSIEQAMPGATNAGFKILLCAVCLKYSLLKLQA